MARNFFRVINDDGDPIYINRAYIVNGLLDANGDFVLHLDKTAAYTTVIAVRSDNAKEVQDWLLEN